MIARDSLAQLYEVMRIQAQYILKTSKHLINPKTMGVPYNFQVMIYKFINYICLISSIFSDNSQKRIIERFVLKRGSALALAGYRKKSRKTF